MRRHIPVTIERLKELSSKASDIIQKNAEAAGTLKMIDAFFHEHETLFQNDELWALRNAVRNIESAIENAADITDTIEEFKGIQNV